MSRSTRREAVSNVDLGPYCIRKGTGVIIGPWLLHRDRRDFDDPEALTRRRGLAG
jgi:cytochrome P450